MRWRHARWAAVGLLVVALALRLAGISARLSLDEAYTWYAASSPSLHVFLERLADYENTPPLVYLIIGALPGSSPAWLRLPSVLAGALLAPLLWAMLRPRIGDRGALLAGLGVAVAPYLVTYSDFARGFMLADLALLGAMWALLALAERETTARWSAFVACGVIAMWLEYASVICWIALALGGLWIGRPSPRRLLIAGGLAAATLLAWLPEIVRGQDRVGVTKLTPQNASPSLAAVRNMVVTLAFGEHGGTSSGSARWAAVAVGLALAGGAVVLLRRGWGRRALPQREAIRLLGAVLVLTPIGYALAALAGVDVFTQRYITILVPVVAGLAGAALSELGVRAVAVTALGLAALGAGNFARRLGAEFQPSLVPVRAAVVEAHPRTVLTNSPLVVYYLRPLRVTFDRPVDLGPGLQASCARPCVAVDDLVGIFGGPSRLMAGTRRVFAGRYRVTIEP